MDDATSESTRIELSDLWRRMFEPIVEAGGGVVEVILINERNIASLITASVAGEPHARRVLTSTAKYLAEAARAKPRQVCLLCDAELRKMPRTVVMMIESRDDVRLGAMSGVCAGCTGDPLREHAPLKRRVMDAYRRITGFQMRELEITDHPGHA